MILIACGLRREARIIAQTGVAVIGGGDGARLETELNERARGASVILSSGIAGALDPSLQPGDIVIDGSRSLAAWLSKLLPDARAGRIVGRDTIVATASEKRALHNGYGARAVDMESHIAARVAERHRLPFAALRTISDSADETLPPAALVGMRPDGGMALGAVLSSLVRNPAQLPALIRTGINAGRAFRSLERCHDVLRRGGIGELDLGKFALDV